MNVPVAMRRAVCARARDRCEYCQLAQAGQEAAFHIDHIEPIAEGGETVLENLALACVSCSLRKGARQKSRDPETKEVVPLFHPRRQAWAEHFKWERARVVGRTSVGRATILALDLNRPLAVGIRLEEMHWLRHPPE